MTVRKAILFGIVSALALTSAATAQTPVQKLQQAGKMSFRFFDSQYYIRIGAQCTLSAAGGGLGDQNPICVVLSDLDGDGDKLDFQITINQMVNSIQSNATVTFYGEAVGSNAVRWQGSRTFSPPECAFIGGSVNQWFQLNDVYGDFTMEITELASCQSDPLNCSSCGVDLRLATATINPPDENVNYLGFNGVLRLGGDSCDTGGPLRACARTYSINAVAYSTSLPSRGDVNGDCTIDDADLLVVLFNFGNSGDGDVNADGIVDDADLLIVLFNFGASC
ncbi:MAG: hypothetical protein CFK49_11550 [Armatimonadetes bacterium JP3_11]|nr:MAG: hypothetical protein CFK49_11550 [Armatimonadetes bacterium JP3_11]RMH09765.1 MAG: hypothetical protein D6697_02680 [Armatimonadota bacterium]